MQGFFGKAASPEERRDGFIEKAQVEPEASLSLLGEFRDAETPFHLLVETPHPLALKEFAPRTLGLEAGPVRDSAIGLEVRHPGANHTRVARLDARGKYNILWSEGRSYPHMGLEQNVSLKQGVSS